MHAFVDSDVVVSSLLSQSGAAYALLHTSQITPIISSLSQKELEIVIERLEIPKNQLETLLKQNIKVINAKQTPDELKIKYEKFVTVKYDAHIVAGAKSADVTFLITYNLKHYKIDKIKSELNIIVMKPAVFLQYLRSI